MILLELFAYAFGLTYALWVFYLAVMALRRAKLSGTLSKTALWLGTPLLFIGLLLDFIANMTVFTVLMLDLPKETLVTYRLKRYAYGEDGWRKRFAQWFAHTLLDDFDPSGKHI